MTFMAHTFAFPRRNTSGLLHKTLDNRGRRECRMRQRTRSLACEIDKAHEIVTTGSPDRPGIPCAMVLTVSSALSPVNGLFCHRHP